MSTAKSLENPLKLFLPLLLAFILAACGTAATPEATSAPAAATATTAPTTAPTETEMPTAAPTETSAPTPAPTETAAMAMPETGSGQRATLQMRAHPTYGEILVDGEGMTLYIFTQDEPNQSNCTGGCQEAWPPLRTDGMPEFGPEVDDSKVGTTTLADGSTVVTYNRRPLYHFSGDSQPGDVNGQGVGDSWFVVDRDGDPVRSAAGSDDSGRDGGDDDYGPGY